MRAAQLIVALLADAKDFDRLALRGERIGPLARQAHDGGVESAAQPALAGADEEKMRLVATAADEQPRACSVAVAAPARLVSTVSTCSA